MNKRYKLLLKRLLLCSLLAGSSLTINSLKAEADQPSYSKIMSEIESLKNELRRSQEREITIRSPLIINEELLQKKRDQYLPFAIKENDTDHVAALNKEINEHSQSVQKYSTELANTLKRIKELEDQIQERELALEALKAPASSTATSEDVPLTQEAQECSICIESIEPNNHDGAQLTCNHAFHKACIDDWFKAQTDKNIHKTCPLCRKDFNNENPFKAEPSTDEVPTLEVAEAAAQIKEQQNIIANLEKTKAAEEKELVKTETKLEEVKVLPLEPVAPIKKKVARHRQKIAQKNDAIGVCKRKIYLLKQAQLKAARRAAAQQNAGQPKKQQSVQDFYGVKKTSKRKSRVRGSRVARRGPARKKTTKRGVSRKKSNKHGARRKGPAKKKSAKRKHARRQAQQTAE